MIIELHPLFEQPWIHALIKPNIRAAQQYGECPHWPIETDGSLPGTCSSYIVAGGQRSETGPPAPIGEFSVHEMHSFSVNVMARERMTLARMVTRPKIGTALRAQEAGLPQ